jgi:methionine-gamma-lyase
MGQINPKQGFGTLVTHAGEGHNPLNAHVTPIYMTSTYSFPDIETCKGVYQGEIPGYIYTRYGSPNTTQLAAKIALLEGLDLVRRQPERPVEEIVGGEMFSTGMAAVTSAMMACVKNGDTVIAQKSLYSGSFRFLDELAPLYGIHVVWIEDPVIANWEKAFQENPKTRMVYAESPSNPTMAIVDLETLASIAHKYGAFLLVDNTFATPFCQRPLTLGADVVIHSTTKYLCGHGLVVGGAVVSPHIEFLQKKLQTIARVMGGTESPFDAWLTNIGLKTFELRMQRHCENAMIVAHYLQKHPGVERVFYPGLEDHPGHDIARRQMTSFGGMLSFNLKGGYDAGTRMLDRVRLCSLAVSLGNVDSLICHPASMTHNHIAREKREAMGIFDGLVRLSLGIENAEDLVADLDQALAK